MANLNRVFLIGRLTADPELRYTAGGSGVTDLRLAVNRMYQTKDGESREEVLFIDVTVWNRQAENCCQFLRKGRQVHVEGYLKMDTWDDKTSGEKRSKVKVEAERVQFLDGKRDEPGGGGFDEAASAPAPPREARRPAPVAEGRGAANGPSKSFASSSSPARRPAEPEAEDDDIPF